MPYTRRRAWPDTDRDDYVIRCESLDVGRVYRTRLPDGEAFVWSIYVNGHVVKGVPISSTATILDAAAKQIKGIVSANGAKAGLPKPNL